MIFSLKERYRLCEKTRFIRVSLTFTKLLENVMYSGNKEVVEIPSSFYQKRFQNDISFWRPRHRQDLVQEF